ncbi:hypothetical protein HUG20_02445 [Salicibibacter cibi]|uniref:Uncharacterized protein n=1 Tax=Salicibibacter cibi TaxID=2743001 RepID=A0A7T7CEB6_9BACI|nr:hypothetical protein [Salicibibacter cibi]QQK78872.1 hypothetical protein HUG20_02445 [Salicibibacter cibi]
MKGDEEPEFVEFMENNGLGLVITDGDDFSQLMDDDFEFYGELITDLELD